MSAIFSVGSSVLNTNSGRHNLQPLNPRTHQTFALTLPQPGSSVLVTASTLKLPAYT
jgi:hypothetical protein